MGGKEGGKGVPDIPEDLFGRGITDKARVNRALGGWIKRCAGARPKYVKGTRAKEYVDGELIRTYTPLVLGDDE